jgi:DNA replication regulator SLD2
MDEQEKAAFEAQSQAIRAELKSWESSWARTHEGKKPGRNDIKGNPEIGTPPRGSHRAERV